MSGHIIEALRNAPGCANAPTFFSPPEFTNWRDEQMSWKQTVSLGNWSFVIKAVLEGADALALLERYSVNSLKNFAINQAKHIINCNAEGKVICQGVAIRLAEDRFFLSGLPCFWIGYQISTGKHGDVRIKIDEHGETCFYQVAGPNAIHLLEEVSNENLRDSKFMRARAMKIAGREVRGVYGLTMSGETGFELEFESAFRDEVVGALLAAGEKFGLRQVGNRTFHINHLEAGVPTTSFHYLPAVFEKEMEPFLEYMNGIPVAENWVKQFKITGSFEARDVSDYYRSPIEMGWVKNVKLDHEFLGREALEAELASPLRQVVTLEFDKEDVIEIYASYFESGEPFEFIDVPHQYNQNTHTDAVNVNGVGVGVSTTPGYSFYFRKMLALAYVSPEFATPGTRVEIVWGQPDKRKRMIGATVAPVPYKKDTRRIDLSSLPNLY
ncbi:hypothetical protein GCM10027416_21420 [Okibacterium endophyticum]